MLKLTIVLAALLSPALSEAAVWPTSNRWNSEWERRYQDWVRTDWKTDIFQNPRSPYAGLLPDCADAVYSMRAIFASQNRLPFAFVDPSTQRTVISNEIRRFDHLPEGPRRVTAFLNWIYGILGTSSLPNDSYPIAINRHAVRPGSFILARENRHSYTVKQIRETGVPVLYYSTQANRGDLMIRSWPSVSYLFPNGIKEPSGFRDFRLPEDLLKPVWNVPGYSNEQYSVPAARWVGVMQSRLALRQETGAEALQRLMDDVCQLVTFRVEVVHEAQTKLRQIGDRCLNAQEYDDLSTPSRDRQLRDAFEELAQAYSRFHNQPLPRQLTEQLVNIHERNASRERGSQFCPVRYGPTISLGEFRRRLFAGMISSNPNDPPAMRWGEARGPSERARRCPTY
jgi:hypothetical protein